jgi:sulfatase maturation enzyme AslB (radical SAM superfamily)
VDLAQLEHVEAFRRYRDRSIPAACSGCPVREDCRGGSVERRWLWTGSLAERDPLCTGAPEVSTRLSPQRAQWKGPLIHLDYLPTIIALPPASTGG